ncbi:50S ribosomal protein L29 [Patescibacteria group bacterium]|nr:50S ribosomal protein L29 [Patescibacteria group bacterium]MBU4458441.1 50S ribosomal protein L29 [Patescibacteria group bacterium]MCG2695971.1 50S ribosomal protein L29 [Candidatus Portnoybacteria bacterium]
MKTKEFKQKTDKELKETLIHLRDNLRELRFNLASGKVKNINEIHRNRRDIARILTLLKQHGQENK